MNEMKAALLYEVINLKEVRKTYVRENWKTWYIELIEFLSGDISERAYSNIDDIVWNEIKAL